MEQRSSGQLGVGHHLESNTPHKKKWRFAYQPEGVEGVYGRDDIGQTAEFSFREVSCEASVSVDCVGEDECRQAQDQKRWHCGEGRDDLKVAWF